MRSTAPGKSILLAIAVVSEIALPARAAERRVFAVAPGPLGPALRAVADQGGGEIGYAEPLVREQRTAGLHGRFTLEGALSRTLAGTALRATRVGPGRFLIEAARPIAAPARRLPLVEPALSGGAIVVTASKRPMTQAAYPGAVRLIPTDGGDPSLPDVRDSSDMVASQPLLQSTAFGIGRDKLFIRGVADSSFAGATQATVGHYFGDTRLLYSGADPALRLVDTQQVEILEGPQGTLYGAGAIGGIVRIVPHAPDASRFGYSLEGSLGATQGGRASHDLDGAVNLPLVSDKAALRLVGYHVYDGGYIDNPALGLRGINGSTTSGGRAALRVTPGAGWTIDLAGLGQRIDTADPQYAMRGDGPLSLAAQLRQPYSDWIALGSLSIRHAQGDAPAFFATIGGVRRDTALRYDAGHAPAMGPIAYDERTASGLIDGEVRLWRTLDSGGGWLVGGSAEQNHTAARRQLGPPDAQRDISGVDNRSLDLALFGEETVALLPGVTVTAGGRLTHARIDGQPLSARPQSTFIRGQARTRFDPTAAFSVQPARGLSLYGRYAQGFRAGGLAVAAGAGRVAVYKPDSIIVLESGVRANGLWGGRLSGTIGISQAWWQHVQADLVARNGFPFTANIGDGRITALEVRLTLRPTPRLTLDGDGLFTHSSIVHPEPGYEREGGNDLPDTPKASARLSLSWLPPIGASKTFGLSATMRYQGHSRFGAGPLFGINQAGYATGDLAATIVKGRFRVRTAIENVPNSRGNRFAVGNPFQLRLDDQYTPLRPRTVRVTFAITG